MSAVVSVPERAKVLCSDCKQPIPDYPDCHGGTGYVSPLSDDAKITQSGGLRALEGLESPVCRPCYRVAFTKKYGKKVKCPVPEDDLEGS